MEISHVRTILRVLIEPKMVTVLYEDVFHQGNDEISRAETPEYFVLQAPNVTVSDNGKLVLSGEFPANSVIKYQLNSQPYTITLKERMTHYAVAQQILIPENEAIFGQTDSVNNSDNDNFVTEVGVFEQVDDETINQLTFSNVTLTAPPLELPADAKALLQSVLT